MDGRIMFGDIVANIDSSGFFRNGEIGLELLGSGANVNACT